MKYPFKLSAIKVPLTRRSSWSKYFIAVAAVGLSTLSCLIMEEYFQEDFPPFTLFYPAVLISAWYGGFWTGLVSTLLATGVVSYLIVASHRTIAFENNFDLLYAMLFFAVNLIISILMENLHRALLKNYQASKDLLTSQKSISGILESIQGCFFTVDFNGNFIHANKDCKKYFPGRMQDVVGKKLWETFPDWQTVDFGKYFSENFKKHTRREFEFLEPDQSRWHEVHFSPTPEGMTVHLYDISSKKRAELALTESENRFRLMSDQAPVMIWLSGPDGKSDYFNQTWLDFRGRSLEEEINHGWTEGVHPDDMEVCLKSYRDAFFERKKFRMEYRLRRHDGVYRWILDSGNPRYDNDGVFLGLIGSAVDITKTRKSEARLRKFVESSLIGIVFGKAHPDRIGEANDVFLNMLGHTRDDLTLGRLHWAEMTPPEFAEIDAKKWQECLMNSYCEPWEKELIRKDGSRVPVLIGLTMLDEAHQDWASFIVDLSERKLQEKRRAMEYSITQILSSDPTLSQAFPKILETICRSTDWDIGFFWEQMPGTELLVCSETWASDPKKYSEFKQQTHEMYCSRDVGLPGLLWSQQQSYWIADINREEKLQRKATALRGNLTSAFGFPIYWKKELLGVMEFFSEQPRTRDAELLNILESIGSEIGQFLERKQAEEDLRLSQMHFNLALQAARMGFWSWNVRTNKMSWSNNLEFFHGRRIEDFSGTFESFLEAVYPEDRDLVRDMSLQALENLTDYNLQFRSQWPDGSIHWIDLRSQIFYDEDGQPTRMVGLGIDMTEQKQAQEDLKNSYDEMEKRVQMRTAELAQANRQLLGEMLERQKVEREALEIIQKEQRRFSAQLHDGLCQQLTGIKMMANAISQKLIKKSLSEGEELKTVVNLINQGVTEARDLARGLFPVELESNSLMFSLRGLATRMEQVYNVRCKFICPTPILIVDNVSATHLFRIGQEAVFNSVQHGEAKSIEIGLSKEGAAILLKVKDDGRGLSQDLKVSQGIGLHIMKYRARLLEATLNFESLETGTLMTCTMPLTPDNINEVGMADQNRLAADF